MKNLNFTAESGLECILCGTLLKKQRIGTNEFYYCRKCGCISSAASMTVPVQSANQQTNVKNESTPQ